MTEGEEVEEAAVDEGVVEQEWGHLGVEEGHLVVEHEISSPVEVGRHDGIVLQKSSLPNHHLIHVYGYGVQSHPNHVLAVHHLVLCHQGWGGNWETVLAETSCLHLSLSSPELHHPVHQSIHLCL